MLRSFLRQGVSALAILGSLVLLPAGSVSPVFAAPQPGNGNVSSVEYSGTLECPSPPVGWDPRTATVDQLHFYGLPLPPARSGTAYLKWVDNMRHATQHVCPKGVASKYHTDTLHQGTFGSNGDYWSGYIATATSNGFDQTQANWTVPCYSGTNNSQRALQWVGIGGDGSSNLWQAGTETDHAEGYRFWWEKVAPVGGVSIQYQGPAVGCGNYVDVEVDYNYTVPGQAYLWMQNYSTGNYWDHQESFAPSNNSAEWIVERTSCGTNTNYALAPTSKVNWDSAYAANTTVDYNDDLPISNWNYYQANMYQNGVDLSDNSGLGSGGTTFTTSYHNSGVSYC